MFFTPAPRVDELLNKLMKNCIRTEIRKTLISTKDNLSQKRWNEILEEEALSEEIIVEPRSIVPSKLR